MCELLRGMLCCSPARARAAAHTAHRVACRRRELYSQIRRMVYACGMLTTHFQPLRPAAPALNLFWPHPADEQRARRLFRLHEFGFTPGLPMLTTRARNFLVVRQKTADVLLCSSVNWQPEIGSANAVFFVDIIGLGGLLCNTSAQIFSLHAH